MYSASEYLTAVLLGLCSLTAGAAPLLRVCADPNNLPYSDQQEKGFENQLASVIANDLRMQLTYTWFPQRGSFFRKTLDAGKCDVVMGVPAGMTGIDTTQPYYRSGYVFVSRRDRNLNVTSLNDPRLHQLRIGIHNLGDTDREAPPVHALTDRGIVSNLAGYNIFGSNLDETNPSSDLIKAVEKGDIDSPSRGGPSLATSPGLPRYRWLSRLSRVIHRIPTCRSPLTLPRGFASKTICSNSSLIVNFSGAGRRSSICWFPMAFHN